MSVACLCIFFLVLSVCAFLIITKASGVVIGSCGWPVLMPTPQVWASRQTEGLEVLAHPKAPCFPPAWPTPSLRWCSRARAMQPSRAPPTWMAGRRATWEGTGEIASCTQFCQTMADIVDTLVGLLFCFAFLRPIQYPVFPTYKCQCWYDMHVSKYRNTNVGAKQVKLFGQACLKIDKKWCNCYFTSNFIVVSSDTLL